MAAIERTVCVSHVPKRRGASHQAGPVGKEAAGRGGVWTEASTSLFSEVSG